MKSILKVLIVAIFAVSLKSASAFAMAPKAPAPKAYVKESKCAAQFYNAQTNLLLNTVTIPNACVSSEAYGLPGGKVLFGSTAVHHSGICGGANTTCAFLAVTDWNGSNPQYIQINQPEASSGPLEDYKFMAFAAGSNGEILALRQQENFPTCSRMHLDGKTYKSVGVEPVMCADWLKHDDSQVSAMSYACPSLAGNFEGTESVENASQAIVHMTVKNKVADGVYSYSFQGGTYFADSETAAHNPLVSGFIADGKMHTSGDQTDKATGIVLSNVKYRVACVGKLVHFEIAYDRTAKMVGSSGDAGETHKMVRFMDLYSEPTQGADGKMASQLVLNMTESEMATDGGQLVTSTIHKLQPQQKGH